MIPQHIVNELILFAPLSAWEVRTGLTARFKTKLGRVDYSVGFFLENEIPHSSDFLISASVYDEKGPFPSNPLIQTMVRVKNPYEIYWGLMDVRRAIAEILLTKEERSYQ